MTHELQTRPTRRGQEASESKTEHAWVLAAAVTFGQNLVAGTCAGLCECLSSYPLDTIKTRLQTGGTSYAGPWACITTTVKEDGALALYRGVSSRLVANMISSSVLFATNGLLKQTLGASESEAWSPRFMAAAAGTGCVEAVVYTPLELVKARMQVLRGQTAAMTPSSCARGIIQEQGLGGLFHGLRVTLLRESIGNLVYFCTYETCKSTLPAYLPTLPSVPLVTPPEPSDWDRAHGKPTPSNLVIALSGGLAGVGFWASIHPVDTVKSLIQTDSTSNPKYKGILDCVQQVLRDQGLRGLYRGLSPSLLRAFIGNAAQFLAFERVMERLDRL